MIDTHSHIYLPEFDIDRDQMIQRAQHVGVTKVLLPAIDSEVILNMLQLASTAAQFCYPMMGLHPCSVKASFEREMQLVIDYLNNPNYKFVAVGECGLDYYWDKTFVAQQKEVFELQIQLAKKHQLPIVIHSRDSTDDCIELIAKHKDANLRGVFHCFSGTAEQLEKIIALDFFAGIGGVVTFKNGGLDKILQPQHLPHLLLETDAPYLAPVPFRGKRNEPAYLSFINKRLSEILMENEAIIADATTANAMRLFFSSDADAAR